jgi:hypothetical protein
MPGVFTLPVQAHGTKLVMHSRKALDEDYVVFFTIYKLTESLLSYYWRARVT